MALKRKLSKSQYTKGLQCGKALWLYRHSPELGAAPDAFQESIMEAGTEFGVLARERWPGGVLIVQGHDDPDGALAATQAAIAAGASVLYEAAFLHDEVLVRVDVLVRLGPPSAGALWELYEVKSGTKVEDVHLDDVAVQRYVMTGAGQQVARSFVVHANPAYVRRGALDLQALFALEDVTGVVANNSRFVQSNLEIMKALADVPEPPEKAIGDHCNKPYPCAFKAHCWAHVPKYSVFNLTGARMDKKLQLYNGGAVYVRNVPDGTKLTAAQARQVAAARSGARSINLAEIRAFLGELRYPLAHLDFETDNPVVPPYDGLRPYFQMPFQASVRVQMERGGPVTERGFLGDGLGDPRAALLRWLVESIPAHGTVLAYHKSFEAGRLDELAPSLGLRGGQSDKEMTQIVARLQDLADPFRTGAYVHPAFEGRWSIKAVLPALVPDLSYKTLEIQDGAQAMAAYAQMRDPALPPAERARLINALKVYCGQDTEAMVRILAHLYEVAA